MLATVEKVLFLKQIPLFSRIPGEELARVARIAYEISFAAGEELIVEGDIGDAAYLIVSGAVAVMAGGNEVASLGQGQFVGEMAILDSEPRSASVIATEDVRALKIEREDFTDLLAERAEIAIGIIRIISWRLRGELRKHSALVG